MLAGYPGPKFRQLTSHLFQKTPQEPEGEALNGDGLDTVTAKLTNLVVGKMNGTARLAALDNPFDDDDEDEESDGELDFTQYTEEEIG